MRHLIIVTFAFLAVAFFQLSGGTGYTPIEGSRQYAALKAAEPVVNTTLKAPATVANDAQNDAKIILASGGQAPAKQSRVQLVFKSENNKPKGFGAVTTVAANPGKIAKLIAAASPTPPPSPKPATVAATQSEYGLKDIRKVTSKRVNMRSGPGKDYGVIGKLTHDTKVEVTQDDGTGWVKLRVLDSGAEGWMADFLLVAAN